MTKDNQKPNTKFQEILGKIQRNELVPVSRTHFRMRLALVVVFGVAVLLLSVFLVSLIFYSVRAEGRSFLIGFGQHGLAAFAADFPWDLFFLDLALVAVFGWLLRTFKFGYKSPVLYLLIGALAVIGLGGYILDATPIHDSLMRHADERGLLGPLGDYYEGLHRPPGQEYGIYRGTIVSTDKYAVEVAIDNPRGIGTTTPVRVLLPIDEDAGDLPVGAQIFIDGDETDGLIQASEIKVIHR